MKKIFLFSVLLFQSLLLFSSPKTELDSVFAKLDETMQRADEYVALKEKQIDEIKQMFNVHNLTPEQQYGINDKLYREYNWFKPDSAMIYACNNFEIAQKLGNDYWLYLTKFNLAGLYQKSGLYLDAIEILNSIDRKELPEKLTAKYFSAYKALYQHYSAITNDLSKYNSYNDSLFMHSEKESSAYQFLTAEKLMNRGEFEKARDIYMPFFKEAEEGSHRQAMMSNMIGKTYRGENNYEMQKKYFAISAIGDMKNAVKEHESFYLLAMACYETNDIERAYKYMYRSMEDALFANLNMRTLKVSQIFPIIEKSYNENIQRQKDKLFLLTLCIGLLSLVLIVAVVYTFLQMKKLAKARFTLSETNRQLNELNDDITRTNKTLQETNVLKDTYINQFLNVCSHYIVKLEKYQNTLNKLMMEHRFDDLAKSLKSREMIENELKELYEIFDRVFINLYPTFVDEFNELLLEEDRFKLKNKESLNTELRIFALIRLGITDSARIADFFRCSIRTVYNYRTRMRGKSNVNSDEFEDLVMKIGTKP